MKKNNYVRVRYDKENDSFRLETLFNDNDEWGLWLECKCLRAEGQTEGEPQMIDYHILTYLMRALDMGYVYCR